MLRIGLTGGIASGKSTVALIFRELGAHVLDADRISRDIVPVGSAVLSRIASAFGPVVLRPDGSLDRQALGAIVFADAGKRQVLEGLLHPLILQEIDRQIEELERAGDKGVVVVEATLIYELGRETEFDAIVVVWAEHEQQRQRLIRRDGLSAEEADRRIETQLPLEEKRRRAWSTVDNSQDRETCRKDTERVYGELQRLAREGRHR